VPDSKLRLPKPELTRHPVDVGSRTEGAILGVPVDGAAKGYMSLRVEPTRNHQEEQVNWAADYLLSE
jgi:hypothetical protein